MHIRLNIINIIAYSLNVKVEKTHQSLKGWNSKQNRWCHKYVFTSFVIKPYWNLPHLKITSQW